MPDPHELQGANVRSSGFYLLSAQTSCPHCGRGTRVFALALPSAHQWLHTDDEDETADAWQPAPGAAVLFHLEGLSRAARNRLRQLAPGYRPARGTLPGVPTWMNHCDHCRESLDDEELHTEPEDAFMPISTAAAQAIQLTEAHEPLEACAAGYVPDAAWLSHTRRG